MLKELVLIEQLDLLNKKFLHWIVVNITLKQARL